MKVLSIFGTRPEAIKMAPILLELNNYSDIESFIGLSGQHDVLLSQAISIFALKETFNLSVMKEGQSLDQLFTKILLGVSKKITQIKPDVILVHGDTTTSFAASLAAYHQRIPIAHVEAGLRTESIYSPWPEEGNRRLTSKLAKYHYAPTELAKENLVSEGIDERKVIITGNTVVDALKIVQGKSSNQNRLEIGSTRKHIVVTTHRRENFGKKLKDLLTGIVNLADAFPEIDFIVPVHHNPNVYKEVNTALAQKNNVKLNQPIPYVEFVNLLSESYLILTDSGGLQEEAAALNVPALIMRDTTERMEAIQAGCAILVGTNTTNIFNKVSELIQDSKKYQKMQNAPNPFGDGMAAKRIVKHLFTELKI
jgi:UDP-N-acetylglucosamine 2-epimerase (non-hydrolysing)